MNNFIQAQLKPFVLALFYCRETNVGNLILRKYIKLRKQIVSSFRYINK